jgi:hypothetical protein
MRCVVDASVALKWFFQSAPDEADVDAVTADRRYFAKAQSIGQILLLDDPGLTALDDRDA